MTSERTHTQISALITILADVASSLRKIVEQLTPTKEASDD